MGLTSTTAHRLFLSLASVVVACLALAGEAFALDKNGNFESKQEQDEFIAAMLKKMAREMNSQTPIQLDEDTRMTSVTALQKRVTFNMRLPRFTYLDVHPNRIEQVAWEKLNHTICQNKATRELIDLGVEYVYLYSGNDGKLISRVVIKSYRCWGNCLCDINPLVRPNFLAWGYFPSNSRAY